MQYEITIRLGTDRPLSKEEKNDVKKELRKSIRYALSYQGPPNISAKKLTCFFEDDIKDLCEVTSK